MVGVSFRWVTTAWSGRPPPAPPPHPQDWGGEEVGGVLPAHVARRLVKPLLARSVLKGIGVRALRALLININFIIYWTWNAC